MKQAQFSPNFFDKVAKLISWSIVSVITLSFLVIPYLYTANVPYFDDYPQVFEFLLFIESDVSWKSKVLYFFSQHNEHRIAIHRFFVYIFSLFGPINFKSLILFAQLMWIGVVVLLSLTIKKEKRSLSTVGLALLLLIPYHGLFDHNAAAFGFSTAYLFPALSFYTFKKSTILSFVLAILSSITLGNGLMVLLIMSLWLFCKGQNRIGAIWFFSFVAVTSLYFYGYNSAPDHPSIIDTMIHQPLKILQFGIFQLGMFAFGISQKSITLAIISGVATLLVSISVLWKNRIRIYESAFLFGMIFFSFGNIALASISRAGFGLEHAFSSRYICFSSILICLVYIIYVNFQNYSDLSLKIIIALFLLNFVFSVKPNLNGIQNRRDYLENGMKSFILTEDFGLDYKENTLGKAWTIQCLEKEIFSPFSKWSTEFFHQICSKTSELIIIKSINYNFEINKVYGDYYLLRGWALIENFNSHSYNIKILFENKISGECRMINTHSQSRPDITAHYNSNVYYDNSGFYFLTQQNEIVNSSNIKAIVIDTDGNRYIEYLK